MWKVNGRHTTDDRQRTTDAKWWQKLTLPLARWGKNVTLAMSSNNMDKIWYLCCSCQLGSPEITISVTQQKFYGPSNWLCTWNNQNVSSHLGYRLNIIRSSGIMLVDWVYWALVINFVPLYRFSIQYGLLQYFPKLYIILYNNRGVVHVNPTTIRSRPPCMFGEYTSPWVQFKLTTSVVIGTDCIGSYKSNYHTITTAPRSV